MKKKIFGLLSLSLLLSSCAMTNDTYVSKRHPDQGQVEELSDDESTDIQYTNTSEEELPSDQDQEETNVEEEDETADYEEDGVDGIEFTTNSTINMRLGPSTSSGVVVEIPAGERIIKIGQNGEWIRATYQGYTGYILTELLTPAD